MDISEFKEMEKNANLLEKALEREIKANKKIDKLKQQQIKDLKNNSKVITVITKTEHTEHLLQRRDPHQIIRRLQEGQDPEEVWETLLVEICVKRWTGLLNLFGIKQLL